MLPTPDGTLTNGAFQLPDRPGLGVTIDENGIEPYVVKKR